jgi:RNA polymerase sigma-70 factor (ECF subfamily)
MQEPFTEQRLMQVYRETVHALYAFASRRCGGDRALAEDVTQEAWLRGVREWRTRGIPDQPLAWLTTVARNLLVDQLRGREHVSLDAVSATDVLAAVDQNAVSDSAEIAAAVNQALARLPKADAQLLESFHFERCHVAELAAQRGVSERSIERHLRTAREHLRRELELTWKAQGETT